MYRRGYNGISQSDFFQILWKLGDILHFILSWHPPKRIEIHSAIVSEPRRSVTFCGEEYKWLSVLLLFSWCHIAVHKIIIGKFTTNTCTKMFLATSQPILDCFWWLRNEKWSKYMCEWGPTCDRTKYWLQPV